MMDPLRSETCWSNFKYFIIILIVSTNYTFVHLLDNKVVLVVYYVHHLVHDKKNFSKTVSASKMSHFEGYKDDGQSKKPFISK